ncbi:uncharacterized protein LOC126215000 [Schistocerca nitens]|uniref:uncharacterized protein LOC126215000 n=1 Tax=Schistocerca nitens TaxID=7011 RepID=UPI002118B547|nr:uncharacterized protein LOC126215000 [Schistocerca nitens]
MEWNTTTLQTGDLRHHILSQSAHAVRRITRATLSRVRCERRRLFEFEWRNKTALQDQATVFRKGLSSYWRDLAPLLSLDATHASQLLVPLAFERMGNHASDQQLHRWIKDMKRVKDMLRTKSTGWLQDLQFASKQVEHYEVEEDKDRPGHVIIRTLTGVYDGGDEATVVVDVVGTSCTGSGGGDGAGRGLGLATVLATEPATLLERESTVAQVAATVVEHLTEAVAKGLPDYGSL